MATKKCQECGVLFCKKLTESKKYWKDKMFCSADCSNKNRVGKHFSPASEFKNGQTSYWKGKELPENVREKISDSSKGRPSNSGSFKKGTKINIGRIRMDMRGKNNPRWKSKIERKCAHCENIISLQPNEVRNKNFCNRQCWALGTRGKGSPVFKGEKSVARYRNRVAELPEYKEWRRAILKRDEYKCTICKCIHSTENPLEVDHKKRFLFIVQENNLKTVEDARNCKELWDTENGRVLCKIDHRASDTYGTKGLSKNLPT